MKTKNLFDFMKSDTAEQIPTVKGVSITPQQQKESQFIYVINGDPSKKYESYQIDTFHSRIMFTKIPLHAKNPKLLPALKYLISEKHATNKYIIYVTATDDIDANEKYFNWKFGTESTFWKKHAGLTYVFNNSDLKFLTDNPIKALPYQ